MCIHNVLWQLLLQFCQQKAFWQLPLPTDNLPIFLKMSLSPYQPPSRSKTRTRTAAQLDRKRARDRESQRLCRERNKERMAKIEAELSTLRARYESLLIVTERLGHIPSPVDSCNAQSISPPAEPAPSIIRSTNSTNSPSPPAWTAAAVPQEIASDFSPQNSSAVTLTAVADDGTVLPNPVDRYVSDGFLTSRLSNECSESNSGDMAYELLSGAGLYQSCPNSHKTLHAPTSTLGTGTSDQLPVSAVDEPLPWPGCFCGTVHRTPTDCLEYNVFHTILNAHMAIAVDTRAARRYPRSPSLANLLLIDVDTNPIVRAIGRMMKCISPMQLADTTAVYFIMYRLLRVCFDNHSPHNRKLHSLNKARPVARVSNSRNLL